MRQISVKMIKMLKREYIIKKIKSLPEDSLKEVADFIEFLEDKREEIPEKKEKKDDPLSKVIGICEGPSDLAEMHDKCVYR